MNRGDRREPIFQDDADRQRRDRQRALMPFIPPLQVPEKGSTFHRLAQRNAFHRDVHLNPDCSRILGLGSA
jgi:hypothetical protein